MGDLFPWLSDHTIRVFSMIGAWVAPPVTILGTLWLARRAEKPRLHVELRRRTPKVIIVGHTRDDISFSVTNVGQRLTTVRSVGLVVRVGWRRVSYGVSTQPMPSELEPGQSCEISYQRADEGRLRKALAHRRGACS